MKKRVWILTASGIFVLVACIVACCLFIIPTRSSLALEVEDNYSIGVGEEKCIEYKCNPDAKVSIEIGRNEVAKIEGSRVIGIKEGFTNIKISAIKGKEYVSKVIHLNIFPCSAELILQSPKDLELQTGQEFQPSYLLSPSSYSMDMVEICIENQEICTLENNKIYALRGGKTKVKLKIGDKILEEFTISVNGAYSLKITGNCTVSTSKLQISPEGSLVEISLNNGNQSLEYLDIEFLSESVSVIKYMGGQYILQGNGELEIRIEEYNFSKIYLVETYPQG